jgi:hypothetical protein
VQNPTSAVYQSQVQASLTPLRTRSPHLVSPTGPPVYEDYTNEVEALYQTVLGRAADPGGLRSGVAFLVGGGTVEQLGVMIAGSPEFTARSGGSDAGFLGQRYQDVLHRAIDAGGQAFWEKALAGGSTRAQVAAAVFSSYLRQRLLLGVQFVDLTIT